MFRALLGELAELGVAVFVGGPLDLFLVALQRETLPVEQIRDRPRGHRVPVMTDNDLRLGYVNLIHYRGDGLRHYHLIAN